MLSPSALHWRNLYTKLMRFLFGHVSFPEREEHQEFRYKLIIVLMTSSALVTALFALGTHSAIGLIDPARRTPMLLFAVSTALLWLMLRGTPKRFLMVCWLYELLWLWDATSSLLYVSVDELHLIWFFTNVPGVFILLGRRVGWLITLGSMLGLLLGNPHLEQPYSSNAMASVLFCLLYLGIFFHAYVGRTTSYFSRMREYNARLQTMASHDPLTQVFNARAYYDACERQVAQSQRSQQPFSVLFIDLDHFKAINDTHGHAAGDEVLRVVARTLSQRLRRSDLLGRIGGEEFSVLLPDTALAGALQVAENLRQVIAQCQPQVDGQGLRITASIGVASRSPGEHTMQALQQSADQAMYEAKKAGRNRVTTLQALSH